MYSRNPEVETQKNESGIILLDMSSGEFYSIYDVASDIWEYIENGTPKEEIIKMIVENYDVPKEQLIADVDAYYEDLIDKGLIIDTTDCIT